VVAVATGRRFRVLIGFAAFGIFWGAWGASLPLVRSHARVDDGRLGTALLLIGLGALISMRVTGTLLDRYGRTVVVIAGAAFAVTGFLPALARGLPALAVTTLLLGVSSGAFDVCVNAMAVEYEGVHERRVLNTAHGLFSVGAVTGAGGVAAARAVDASLLTILLASQAVVLVVALAALPSREPWQPRVAAAATRMRWRIPPALLVLGALCAIAYLVENAWQSWSALLLQSAQGAAPAASSAAAAVFAGCAAAGRLTGDRLAERFGPSAILTGGAGTAAAGSLLAAQAPTPALGLGGVAIAGLGTSVCAPTLLGAAGRADVALGRAAAISTVTTLAYLGFLVGPPLVGLLSAVSSLPTALSGVAVLAGVLALGAGFALGRAGSAESTEAGFGPSGGD
jgi:MFS family permease